VPLNPQGAQRSRDFAGYFCYARLRPGVSLAQADADVKRVAAGIATEYPKEHRQYTAVLVNLLDSVVKDVRPALLLLLGAAGALLLITCANVAGLLLARSVTRARETAMRVTLGAARWQLALQYGVEGLWVAFAGAAGGVAVSVVIIRLVLSLAADSMPRADGIGINWTALLFALGAAIVASVLFNLAPLWQAARMLPNEVLSNGVRASAPASSRRLSRTLVVAEIALAFTLLTLSATLIAHLNRLLDTPSGFEPGAVLTFSINTSRADYPGTAQLAPYQKRLLEAIERIAGVTGAALVDHLPLAGCCYVTSLFPDGISVNDNGFHEVNLIVISPAYFRTMRIPVLKGRYFDERDDGSGDVLGMVIDSAAAKLYWPGRDALGAYARLGGPDGTRVKIVGIVGNVRNRGLGEQTEAEVYLPSTAVAVNAMHFVVRSALPASTLAPEIRRSIQSVDPSQPLYEVRTMPEIVLGSVTTERLQSFLTTFFAATALLLAALGIYGVVSYSVRNRTVEFGTRMALGALGRDVLRLVLGEGLRMAAYGIAGGAAVAIAAALLLKSEIAGIRIDNAGPFLYSAVIVAAITTLACFFPAWRATLVAPMAAIRDDSESIWRSARTLAKGLAPFHRDPKRVSGLISAVSEGALVAEFVDSSRRAESFREATQLALTALREAIECESALLLERSTGKVYRCVARTPGECGNGCTVPEGGLLIGRLRAYPYPLPLTREDLDVWSRWAAKKPESLNEIECLRGTAAALAVPLLAKKGIAGILLFGPPIGRSEYSAAEKHALRSCAAQFALMIENARLTDRMVEQEKLNRDIQLAAEVQKRLFPEKPPPTAVVTLTGMSLPARSVGGDYYDFLDLGDQRIGIALADVAGKGVAAALIMSVVQAALRIYITEENESLATLAARLNRFLHRSTPANAYATFFYAQIDERKRQLRYVNAGHNPPYLLRYSTPDQLIEELPAGGTVIGLFPQSSYKEESLDLQAGDVLLAYTDGVTEALNPQDEEFGEERLKSLLRRSAHLPVAEMASMFTDELKNWIDNAAQYDDLTFILMKVNSKSESAEV
jgi:putative ABC transport system permease protein